MWLEEAAGAKGRRTHRVACRRVQNFQSTERFRGGLVFKAQRLVYHSTLGFRVIKKKKNSQLSRTRFAPGMSQGLQGYLAHKKPPPPRTLQYAYSRGCHRGCSKFRTRSVPSVVLQGYLAHKQPRPPGTLQ